MEKDEQIIFCPFADDGRIICKPESQSDLKTEIQEEELEPES